MLHYDYALSCAAFSGQPEMIFQINERQRFVAKLQDAILAGAFMVFLRQLHAFNHLVYWNHIGLIAYAYAEALDNGQRKRQPDPHCCSHTRLAGGMHTSAQRLDNAADYIHADSASGHIADMAGCGETRLKDQL